MPTFTLYAAAAAPATDEDFADASTHVQVLTDATNVIATLVATGTVDFGDPLAGTILKVAATKITYDTGTFRVLQVT